ncbi:unnamed protein product, partial [Pylaiella littoralis]
MGATWLCNVHWGRARKQLGCRRRVRWRSHRWSRLDFFFAVFWRIFWLGKHILCKRGAAVEGGGLMTATVWASSAATAATAVTSMVPVMAAATAAGTETRVIGPTTAATAGAPTGAGLLTAASDSPLIEGNCLARPSLRERGGKTMWRRRDYEEACGYSNCSRGHTPSARILHPPKAIIFSRASSLWAPAAGGGSGYHQSQQFL